MRVLQLCHRLPYPPLDGGSIAMNQITEGLLDLGVDVKVVAFSIVQDKQQVDAIPAEYIEKTGLEVVSIDNRAHPIPALINLLKKQSYIVERYHCKAMSDKISDILSANEFDIIQLEGLYLTPYIPVIKRFSNAPVLYRAHNIEHFIWLRLARASRTPLKRHYLNLMGKRLQRYETSIIREMDGVVAITENDLQFFRDCGYKGPSVVIPAAISKQSMLHQAIEPDPMSVFHLGSMDWRPNQEGVLWFLKKVWPLVAKENRGLRFYLAGRKMPANFYHFSGEQVEIVGEVEDATMFLLSMGIMVVPLLSGGGMRVKIIEGMAAGKTIVSTTVGAEGIACRNRKNILLADDPKEMANLILECINNPQFSQNIGSAAKDFVQRHYAVEKIISRLFGFYQSFYSE